MDWYRTKKRIAGILAVGSALLVTACGYRAGQAADAENAAPGDIREAGVAEDAAGSAEQPAWQPQTADSEQPVQQQAFRYDHEYNKALQIYGEDVYLAREDGIYRIKDGRGEEELVYANKYAPDRGRNIELYGNHLYFCGSTRRGNMETATVYCMNPDTLEVTDALALSSCIYRDLYGISVYEDKLYVAVSYTGHRIGFALLADGMLGRQLDETAAGFPYKEHNAYADLEERKYTTDSLPEYESIVREQKEKYEAVLDVAACKELLGARQVVSRQNANDDLMRCVYLKEGQSYEYLCDISERTVLVVREGMYYVGADGGVWYVDFASKQSEKLWAQTREWAQIRLLTYDDSYIYLVKARVFGSDADGNALSESCLMRIPRTGGEAQRIYCFEKDLELSVLLDKLCGACSVYADKMYIQGYHDIVLDPDANGVQASNGGRRSADSVDLERAAKEFAQAYFRNDKEACRLLLTERLAQEEQDLYAYPEHAGAVEFLYLGGLPEGNVDIGDSVCLSLEIREYGADALTYLSMILTKTSEGFLVDSYGLEG